MNCKLLNMRRELIKIWFKPKLEVMGCILREETQLKILPPPLFVARLSLKKGIMSALRLFTLRPKITITFFCK